MTAPDGAHARRLEAQTRALLYEAAGLVVPGDGLPAIRARTRRSRWRRVLAAAVSWVAAPRHTHHVFRPDWLDTTDARCWCGARPADRTAALGWTPGAAAEPNSFRELKDMAIIRHEDASVYGKGVVHHPLSGRPEFKGLLDSPDGPMARIQDGDLVLTIDDMATLLRWRDAFQRAAAQMQLGLDRAAKNGSTR